MCLKMAGRIIYPKLSYMVVGVCFDAHNELGRFAREKQYGDYIEKRLEEEGLDYKREFQISDSGNIADFLIENKMLLELKARDMITKKDYFQVQRYLQATGVKLGILVNFRNKYLRPKRIVKTRKKLLN